MEKEVGIYTSENIVQYTGQAKSAGWGEGGGVDFIGRQGLLLATATRSNLAAESGDSHSPLVNEKVLRSFFFFLFNVYTLYVYYFGDMPIGATVTGG